MSVPRAQRPARGMSRTGLWDSSAASGSSSIPRKNHMANGRANRIGRIPCGRNAFWPASGTMSNSDAQLKCPLNSAIAEKKRMIAIEMTDTMIANLNDTLAPAVLSATKRA